MKEQMLFKNYKYCLMYFGFVIFKSKINNDVQFGRNFIRGDVCPHSTKIGQYYPELITV